MGFLQPLAFWLALTIPVIVLFYFLKLKRPERPVSSVLLWSRAAQDARAATPWQRLRLSLLLLLQVLLAAALALAVARPFLAVAGGGGEDLVVLLDASASMQAADEAPDRFAAARERVARLIEGLGPRDRMALVAFGREPEVLAPLTGERAELRRALQRARVSAAQGRSDEALSLALSLLEDGKGGTLVVVGDGGLGDPDVEVPPGVRVRHLPVGRGAGNLGILGFSVRGPAEPAAAPAAGAPGWSALVRVANFDREPHQVSVEVSTGGRVAASRSARLEAGAEAQVLFTGLPAADTFAARLLPGDDYPLDDRAWAVAPRGMAGRALLVTAGNPFLARILSVQPGLEVYWVRPEDYAGLPAGDPYDLYVFDGFLPPAWPPGSALVVGPPPAAAPLPVGDFVAGGPLAAPDPGHPLLRYVAWDEVTVGRARQVALPAGWQAVLGTEAAPLLAVGEAEGRRVAVLAFTLQESDLPLRTAFPVLVRNLLDWLVPAGLSLPEQAVAGEDVTVTASPAATAVEVVTPEGERVALAPPFPPPPFRPERPGLYTVVERAGGREREVPLAVNAPGGESDIAPRAELPPALARAAGGAGAGSRLTNAELWPWLGWLALALMLAEWGVYSRGR